MTLPNRKKSALALVSGCTRCGACATRCAFLQEYGLPGEIAATWSAGQSKVDPFACSLCDLCAAVCPEKLEPGEFFLELRRRAAADPDFDSRPYRPLLSYERLGASPLFAGRSLPAGCKTVFFPGCTLPGSRPQSTRQLYNRLRELVPGLGLVLNCCHKPSHDLGLQSYFTKRFGDLQQALLKEGVREIVVACPNCYKVFLRYGGKLRVKSAWELLADQSPPKSLPSRVTSTSKVTIHDPCPLRHSSELQQAVRRLVASHGLEVKEMKSAGRRTLCCGEGGAVGRVRPELAAHWGKLRREQADGLPVLTYCAGCAGFLHRIGLSTIHLADLLADPVSALKGKSPVSTGLKTYLNRLLCKFSLLCRHRL
ncbi:MAG: (Fe-S)-binding protein [Desulfurivibrio sp.]|nr:(Fe-S)-binding protein [Desulfurivibrio sp.]